MPSSTPLFTEDQLLVLQLTGVLPLMLTTRQAAAVIGVKLHDIKAFVRAGVLTPLAIPLADGDGYFERDALLALKRLDLVKGRRAMKAYWAAQNEN
jgi:hypothetical protein